MATASRNFMLLIVVLVVLISRIPFLENGYGPEEDSWGLVLSARSIAQTHSYEASRLPGHPLQEYTYALLPDAGAFVFNLFTALLSVLAVLFFALALRKLSVSNHLVAGLSLAFVPVLFVNSTNNLDYLWALAFIMISFFLVIDRKYWLAGIILGLAAGSRITSLLMLIPFLFYVWNDKPAKKITASIYFTGAAGLATIFLFTPVYLKYGPGFFTATDYFPFPPAMKVIYKGTLGVWGALGMAALLIPIMTVIRRRKLFPDYADRDKKAVLLKMSLVVILLYVAAYLLKPEKSAYLIQAVPFFVLACVLILERKLFLVFAALMVAAPFLAGVNLENSLRGSESSSLSLKRTIAGQNISFDLLQGPVMADYYKRRNKMKYSSGVIEKISDIKNNTLVIAGWWYNEILVRQERKNPAVELVFYTDEDELKRYTGNNYAIFYLAEQNTWNDIRYGKKFTDKYARPIPE